MSIDANSIASIDKEIQILSRVKTNQHISHAQARGIIPLFNHYFREKDSNGRTKRLNKAEKERRWKIYKVKVYKDYNRLIKGTQASEAALIKRYSDPLSFLKYKTKNYINLKVSDLSKADQEYYREIGGLDDIEELRRRQANIDSIDKGAERVFKKRRLNPPDEASEDVDLASNNANNHNRNPPSQMSIAVPISQNLPPEMPSLSQPEPPKMDAALEAIFENYNQFEREKMEKQRDAAKILTEEKTKTFLKVFSDQATSDPLLIGMLPGSSSKDQLTNAFHAWISKNVDRILSSGVDRYELATKASELKGNEVDTMIFLQEWKMIRMLFKDSYLATWGFIKRELEIRCDDSKQEQDFDEEKAEDLQSIII